MIGIVFRCCAVVYLAVICAEFLRLFRGRSKQRAMRSPCGKWLVRIGGFLDVLCQIGGITVSVVIEMNSLSQYMPSDHVCDLYFKLLSNLLFGGRVMFYVFLFGR